jgi:hypothetical protein
VIVIVVAVFAVVLVGDAVVRLFVVVAATHENVVRHFHIFVIPSHPQDNMVDGSSGCQTQEALIVVAFVRGGYCCYFLIVVVVVKVVKLVNIRRTVSL